MKLSLCLCVWNTSHLLKRSMETYAKQDFPRDEWELIVIDDNSEDDVRSVILPFADRINLKYARLDHAYGMRGNTVSFNTAFGMARGDILAETTPETMFQSNVVSKLYAPHADGSRRFVAMKTLNLTKEIQADIDRFDWRRDIMEIAKHPNWSEPWVQANVGKTEFRTHQTCSIRRETWFSEINSGNGFPLFCGYGEDDPWYSGQRERLGILDIVVMDPMPIHQWHPPFQYWMARGKGPRLNRFAHTMDNYMNDKSGHVPDGGTCCIFDGGSHEMLSEKEIAEWNELTEWMCKTGCTVA